MEKTTTQLLSLFDKSVTELDLSNSNISGCLDLNEFKNLEKLNCSHNAITSIKNLPYFIKYLDCSYNKIDSLVDINRFLNYLNCKKNPIKTLYYPFDIKPEKYPRKLEHLIFADEFNQYVDTSTSNFNYCDYILMENYTTARRNDLPNTLISLKFGGSFNKPVENLPNKIQKLTFGNGFNKPVNNLPNSITHLTFGRIFNKPVNHLPKKLLELNFGSGFNQSINSLPSSLTYLSFELDHHIWSCKGFNKPISNLPSNITEIHFGDYFNQPLNFLPSGIKNLSFGKRFNQSVDNLQTFGITHLMVGKNFNHPLDNLPNTIVELTFRDDSKFNLPIDNLPESLKKLTLSKHFNQPLDHLPNGLTHLIFQSGDEKYDFYSSFTQSLDNLPNSLTHLFLPDSNDIDLRNLPESLEFISIGGSFEKSIDNLPDNIREIVFRTNISRDSDGKFDDFTYPKIKNVKINKLPSKIKKIIIERIELFEKDGENLVHTFNCVNSLRKILDELDCIPDFICISKDHTYLKNTGYYESVIQYQKLNSDLKNILSENDYVVEYFKDDKSMPSEIIYEYLKKNKC